MAQIRRAVRHPDTGVLAAGVAARLSVTIMDALAERPAAHVLIGGGPLILAGLAALARQPLVRAVDFSRVHVWWSDDVLAPSGDPARNETAARGVLRPVIAFPPTHVHAMPTGPADPWAAADAYAGQLRQHGEPDAVPDFDVAILELGRGGQIAGLHPDQPEARVVDRPVVPVVDPLSDGPVCLTVTTPVLRSPRRVWLLAAGAEVVEATRAAWHAIPDPAISPASVVRGREETLLLLDSAAGAALIR